MKIILLLLFFLGVSCVDNISYEDEQSSFVLHALLYADQKVDKIQLKRIINLKNENDTTPQNLVRIYYADIELSTDDSIYELKPDVFGYYSSEHIVKEGKTYRINISFYDSLANKDVAISAETYIPLHNRGVHLSQDTMNLATNLVYLDTYYNPEKFPKIDVDLKNEFNCYHDVALESIWENSDPNWIYKEYEITPIYNKDVFKGNECTIYPYEVHRYSNYRILISNITKNHYNLYLDMKDGDSWLKLLSELPATAVSNVENAWGVFTGISVDTAYFNVSRK